jgi:hypothetical protein
MFEEGILAEIINPPCLNLRSPICANPRETVFLFPEICTENTRKKINLENSRLNPVPFFSEFISLNFLQNQNERGGDDINFEAFK